MDSQETWILVKETVLGPTELVQISKCQTVTVYLHLTFLYFIQHFLTL